jgi:hypothetical protein
MVTELQEYYVSPHDVQSETELQSLGVDLYGPIDIVINTYVPPDDEPRIIETAEGTADLIHGYGVSSISTSDSDGDTVADISDCNMHDPTIYGDAPEVCGDNIDQNCNGFDEGCLSETCMDITRCVDDLCIYSGDELNHTYDKNCTLIGNDYYDEIGISKLISYEQSSVHDSWVIDVAKIARKKSTNASVAYSATFDTSGAMVGLSMMATYNIDLTANDFDQLSKGCKYTPNIGSHCYIGGDDQRYLVNENGVDYSSWYSFLLLDGDEDFLTFPGSCEDWWDHDGESCTIEELVIIKDEAGCGYNHSAAQNSIYEVECPGVHRIFQGLITNDTYSSNYSLGSIGDTDNSITATQIIQDRHSSGSIAEEKTTSIVVQWLTGSPFSITKDEEWTGSNDGITARDTNCYSSGGGCGELAKPWMCTQTTRYANGDLEPTGVALDPCMDDMEAQALLGLSGITEGPGTCVEWWTHIDTRTGQTVTCID